MKRMMAIVWMMLAILSLTALAEGDYRDYAGNTFLGVDPWEGRLFVEIKSIEDGKMTWRLTNKFDGATYKEWVEDTDLNDGAFHIIDAAKEDYSRIIDYTGVIALKDGAVVLTYQDGQAYQLSPEGGSGYHMVQALDEAARTVTLARVLE